MLTYGAAIVFTHRQRIVHAAMTVEIGDLKSYRVRNTVFNATFNKISVISWPPVLLMEETGVPKKTQTCSESLTSYSRGWNV